MKHNPIFFFSAVASLTIIPGIGILGWVLYQQYLTGSWHSGWALIGVLLSLFATQAIAVAAISALMKRTEQRLTQQLAKKVSSNRQSECT